MNERIRELAEKCWVDDECGYGCGRTQEFDQEKFAELIVKECARIARATPAPNFHEHLKQQLGHTWDMACIESGREIVKHFGVE